MFFDLNIITKVLKKTISTEKMDEFLCRPAESRMYSFAYIFIISLYIYNN